MGEFESACVFIVGLGLGLLLTSFVCIMGFKNYESHDDIVARGCAEYVLEGKEVKFKWREND